MVSLKDLTDSLFNKLSLKEREQILLNRPTPDLQLSTSSRSFDRELYTTWPWLTGCPDRQKLFCFPCILFSKDRIGPWNLEHGGLDDLDNLADRLDQHAKSMKHADSTSRFQLEMKLIKNQSTISNIMSNGSKKSAFASLSGGDYREANDQQISTKNEFISKTTDNRSSDKDCIITIDEEEDTEKRHETRSLVVGASKIIEKKKTALTRVQDTVAYSRVQSSALLSSQSGGSVISNRLENLSPSSTTSKPKWTPPNKAKKKKLKIDAWPSIHVSTGPGPHFLHIPPLSESELSKYMANCACHPCTKFSTNKYKLCDEKIVCKCEDCSYTKPGHYTDLLHKGVRNHKCHVCHLERNKHDNWKSASERMLDELEDCWCNDCSLARSDPSLHSQPTKERASICNCHRCIYLELVDKVARGEAKPLSCAATVPAAASAPTEDKDTADLALPIADSDDQETVPKAPDADNENPRNMPDNAQDKLIPQEILERADDMAAMKTGKDWVSMNEIDFGVDPKAVVKEAFLAPVLTWKDIPEVPLLVAETFDSFLSTNMATLNAVNPDNPGASLEFLTRKWSLNSLQLISSSPSSSKANEQEDKENKPGCCEEANSVATKPKGRIRVRTFNTPVEEESAAKKPKISLKNINRLELDPVLKEITETPADTTYGGELVPPDNVPVRIAVQRFSDLPVRNPGVSGQGFDASRPKDDLTDTEAVGNFSPRKTNPLTLPMIPLGATVRSDHNAVQQLTNYAALPMAGGAVPIQMAPNAIPTSLNTLTARPYSVPQSTKAQTCKQPDIAVPEKAGLNAVSEVIFTRPSACSTVAIQIDQSHSITVHQLADAVPLNVTVPEFATAVPGNNSVPAKAVATQGNKEQVAPGDDATHRQEQKQMQLPGASDSKKHLPKSHCNDPNSFQHQLPGNIESNPKPKHGTDDDDQSHQLTGIGDTDKKAPNTHQLLGPNKRKSTRKRSVPLRLLD